MSSLVERTNQAVEDWHKLRQSLEEEWVQEGKKFGANKDAFDKREDAERFSKEHGGPIILGSDKKYRVNVPVDYMYDE